MKDNYFSGWELETIFHLASNSANEANSPFFEKYLKLASKAANLRAQEYPDYLKQYGVDN